MNEDAYREAQGLPWERLIDLFGQMVARFTVDSDGTAWPPMSDWVPTEVLAYEVARRTEEPGTVQDMMLRRLASATMTLVAAVCYGTEHLESWTREWVLARGELMVTDIDASPAVVMPEPPPEPVGESWEPELVPHDPLAGYVDVEGGYRWFYDGRPPEPVQD
jgi:hypothetical protein